MSSPVILGLMTFCFLFFGYLGVPVPFSLLAGVFVGALLTDVSLAAIIQKVFDGVDSEALLAIPFFLLVGELMSSANVVVRIANLSLSRLVLTRVGELLTCRDRALGDDVRLGHQRGDPHVRLIVAQDDVHALDLKLRLQRHAARRDVLAIGHVAPADE